MKKDIQFHHIIDIEYFFHQDKELSEDILRKRDREIFLAHFEDTNTASPLNKKNYIRKWVEKRKQEEFHNQNRRSPGDLYQNSVKITKLLGIVKGLFLGIVSGSAFFAYSGLTPINIFHFLLLFIIPQFFLGIILLVLTGVRSMGDKLQPPSVYCLFFHKLIERVTTLFNKGWWKKLPADKRQSAAYAFGLCTAKSKFYGSLFYWPLFTLFQVFLISFNIGLLSSTLIKITISDLAFGWQSTLRLSAGALHHTTQIIAFPWSWLFPEGVGYPTISEIEGSRIILKEGILNLATKDLVAWWPFLVLCLICYGLLFRCSLLILGKYSEQRALKKIRFNSPNYRTLLRRLLTPIVSSQATPEVRRDNKLTLPKNETPESTEIIEEHQIVLVPDDIYDLCNDNELSSHLNSRGFTISEKHRFMIGFEEDIKLRNDLTKKGWPQSQSLLFLMEGWMVPLEDFLHYIKEFRNNMPANINIHIGLLGHPESPPEETIFTPVLDDDLTIWEKKIQNIGDPYLNIFCVIE